MTQFGEDGDPARGAFNDRMLGFVDQPTDHYLRPVYLVRPPADCYGSTPSHVIVLDWVRQFVHVYRAQPKFSFVVFGAPSSENLVAAADDDLRYFLRELADDGYLDNTLLVLASTTGARAPEFRSAEPGRTEERNPYLGIRLPPWMQRKHPTAAGNLRSNARRLVTPFDVHATFEELVNFTGSGGGGPDDDAGRHRGISLFKEIPARRTCDDADVAPHLCNCLERTSTTVYDVRNVVAEVVRHVNNLTKDLRDLCSEFSVADTEVRSAVRYGANKPWRRFRGSTDVHERVPTFYDVGINATEFVYVVRFSDAAAAAAARTTKSGTDGSGGGVIVAVFDAKVAVADGRYSVAERDDVRRVDDGDGDNDGNGRPSQQCRSQDGISLELKPFCLCASTAPYTHRANRR